MKFNVGKREGAMGRKNNLTRMQRAVTGVVIVVAAQLATRSAHAQPVSEPSCKIETGVYCELPVDQLPSETGTLLGPNEGEYNGNVQIPVALDLATYNSQHISPNNAADFCDNAREGFGMGLTAFPAVCPTASGYVVRLKDGTSTKFTRSGISAERNDGDLRILKPIDGGFQLFADSSATAVSTVFKSKIVGNLTTLYYPTKTTYPDGSWVTISYESSKGRNYPLATAIEWSNGNSTTFGNDSDNITSVTFSSPEGVVTYKLAYSGKGTSSRLAEVVHPDASKESYTWSSQGYLIRVTGLKGARTNFSYYKVDATGSIYHGQPVAHATEHIPADYADNEAGWKVVLGFSRSFAIDTRYLRSGLPIRYQRVLLTEVTGSNGSTKVLPKETYDGLDILDWVKDRSFTYDSEGRLSELSAGPGQITTYTYDEQAPFLLKSVANPDGSRVEYLYAGESLAYEIVEVKSYGSDGSLASTTNTTFVGANDNRVKTLTSKGASGHYETVTNTYGSGYYPTMVERIGTSGVTGYTEHNLPTGFAGPGGLASLSYAETGDVTQLTIDGFTTTFGRSVDSETGELTTTASDPLESREEKISFDDGMWAPSRFDSTTTANSGGGGGSKPMSTTRGRGAWTCKKSSEAQNVWGFNEKTTFSGDSHQEAMCARGDGGVNGLSEGGDVSGNAYPVNGDCSAVPGATPSAGPTITPSTTPSGTTTPGAGVTPPGPTPTPYVTQTPNKGGKDPIDPFDPLDPLDPLDPPTSTPTSTPTPTPTVEGIITVCVKGNCLQT